LQDPTKFTQIWIFGLKTNHLATLAWLRGDTLGTFFWSFLFHGRVVKKQFQEKSIFRYCFMPEAC
jgi:hypothetical protein